VSVETLCACAASGWEVTIPKHPRIPSTTKRRTCKFDFITINSLSRPSPADQHDERAQGAGYFRRAFIKKIAPGKPRKLNRGPLSSVGDIVETGWEIRVPDEAGSRSSYEIRDRRHRAPGIGAVDKRERKSVEASRQRIMAVGGDVAGIFPRDHPGHETCRPKAVPLRDGVSEVVPEALRALPPVRGVSGCPFTGGFAMRRPARNAGAVTAAGIKKVSFM